MHLPVFCFSAFAILCFPFVRNSASILLFLFVLIYVYEKTHTESAGEPYLSIPLALVTRGLVSLEKDTSRAHGAVLLDVCVCSQQPQLFSFPSVACSLAVTYSVSLRVPSVSSSTSHGEPQGQMVNCDVCV